MTGPGDAALQAAHAAIPCTCGGEHPAKGRTGHHAWCNRNAVDIGTVTAMLAAARPHLAADERERIVQFADHHEARRACLECGNYADATRAPCCPKSFWFADLLRDPTPPEGDPS